MEERRADLLASIQELRAKAAQQLTGNDYYMMVQQLDSLEANGELGSEDARSILAILQSRLAAGGTPDIPTTPDTPAEPPAPDMPGKPEIPPAPDTPAEPPAPSGPEEPIVPDTPADPEPAPGPDIPPPVESPPAPGTPQEVPTLANATEQVIWPQANSFSSPQAASAISFAPDAVAEAAAPAATALAVAVDAAQAKARGELTGNRYYMVANLLGALRDLPSGGPSTGGGFKAESWADAFEALRREAGQLADAAKDEAARLLGAIEAVLAPPAAADPAPVVSEPVPTPQAEPELKAEEPAAPPAAEPTPVSSEAAPEPQSEPELKPEEPAAPPAAEPTPASSEAAPEPQSEPVAEAEEPIAAAEAVIEEAEEEEIAVEVELEIDEDDAEPEPAPRTGFDDLADAAWKRVVEVSGGSLGAPARLNGSAAPHMTAAPKPAVEAAAPAPAPAPVEPTPAPSAPVVEIAAAMPAAAVAEQPEAPAEIAPTAQEPEAIQPMAEDNGEAFSDGGAESRSSEPCYINEFRDYTLGIAPSTDAQPADAASDAPAETGSEAPALAEAAPLAAVEAEALMEAEAEPLAESTAPVMEAQPAAEPETVELAAQHRVAEESGPGEADVVPEDKAAASTEEPMPVEAVAASEPAAPMPESIEAAAAPETVAPKPTPPAAQPAEQVGKDIGAKRGLFSRLFGGRSAERH